MAYEKTNWVNDETPLNAENMNKIEQGIENLQILQGTSAPDSSIVAEIGQFYLDTVAKKLYQYVAIDEWINLASKQDIYNAITVALNTPT